MTLLLLAVTFSFSSFADSVQARYAQKDAQALEDMLAEVQDHREAAFLCRYRLYPLTEDDAHLQELPKSIENGSARELALLSGLWGYRAARASMLRMVTYGRRAQRLLSEAREIDPLDPYVLLVEGQSLLFTPGFAGGDAELALRRFRQLESVLDSDSEEGITPMEASMWVWYAMRDQDNPDADALRQDLLSQDPPPLFREFLNAPPT